MPATYEPIATTTLGSAQNTITFSSIPATYTDLKLILVGAVSIAAVPFIKFNSTGGTAYNSKSIYGNGTAVNPTRSAGDAQFQASYVTNFSTTIPGMIEIDVFSYTSSYFKTSIIRTSLDLNGSGVTETVIGQFNSTSVINAISLNPETRNWNAGTTATLYGILRA